MSDTSGRRLSFILCYVIFIVANVGLALQTNYIALLLLRMLQAVGCSAAIALAFAIVSDVSTSAERGKYMGYAGAVRLHDVSLRVGIVTNIHQGHTLRTRLCAYNWRTFGAASWVAVNILVSRHLRGRAAGNVRLFVS
jgi:MFS family permease